MSAQAAIRPRILLYEPIESIAIPLFEFLDRSGFAVDRAHNFEQAGELAWQRWYRFLILHMDPPRTIEHFSNVFAFLKKFPVSNNKILHVEIPEYLPPNQLLRFHRDLHRDHQTMLIPKGEIDDLLDAIRTLQQETFYNDELMFHPSGYRSISLLASLDPDLPASLYPSRLVEVEDLLRLAILGAKVSIERIISQHHGQVTAHLSLLPLDGPEEQRLLYLSSIKHPQQKNEKSIVIPAIGIPKVIHRENRVVKTTHYELSCYVLENDPTWDALRTLKELLQEGRVEEIEQAIERLFDFVLGSWEKSHGRVRHEKRIGDIYIQKLGLPPAANLLSSLAAKLNALMPGLETHGVGIALLNNKIHFNLAGESFSYPDPIILLPMFLRQELSSTTHHMPCHINLEYVLLDTIKHFVWVSHLDGQENLPEYWPAIMLEQEIQQFAKTGPSERIQLLQALYNNNLNGNHSLSNTLDGGLARLVQQVRRKNDLSTEHALRAYQTGLIYFTIAWLLSIDPKVKLTRNQATNVFQTILVLCLLLKNFQDLGWILPVNKRGEGKLVYEANADIIRIDGRDLLITGAQKEFLVFCLQKKSSTVEYLDVFCAVVKPKQRPLGIDTNIINHVQQIKRRVTNLLKELYPKLIYFENIQSRGYQFHNPPLKRSIRRR